MPKALVINKRDYEQSTIYYNNQLAIENQSELLNIEGYGMFPPEYIKDPLFELTPFLADREVCETEESLLQVIPYIVLFDTSTDKVFIYQRGGHCDESRLRGKCSIGLGGHVERAPGNGVSFARVVAEEAARELYEEVGIITTNELILDLENRFIDGKYIPIYNEDTAVSRVHLGLGLVSHCNPGGVGSTESKVIDSPNWMHPIDIIAQHERGIITLEEWSYTMIVDIYESFIVPALPSHPFTLQEARQNLILR